MRETVIQGREPPAYRVVAVTAANTDAVAFSVKETAVQVTSDAGSEPRGRVIRRPSEQTAAAIKPAAGIRIPPVAFDAPVHQAAVSTGVVRFPEESGIAARRADKRINRWPREEAIVIRGRENEYSEEVSPEESDGAILMHPPKDASDFNKGGADLLLAANVSGGISVSSRVPGSFLSRVELPGLDQSERAYRQAEPETRPGGKYMLAL